MRRLLVLVLLLPALLLTGVGSLQQKTFVWQRVQTDVQARADGSLHVSEALTLRYTGGSFTFAFRDLPTRRLDRIDNIAVRDQERTYQQVSDREGTTPYTFSIATTNSGQRVRWVYPQTDGGTRTFMPSYDVYGAVRRGANADEIWWAMVFAARDAVVEQAEGTIALPVSVPAAQLQATTPDVSGMIERADGRASVQANNIAPGQELTLRLQFPKGVVGGATPAWQAATAAQEQYNATIRPMVNVGLSALAALLAVLLGGLIWRWWQRNRDPQPRGFVAAALPDVPDDLPPALAAKLTNANDWQALIATAVDLANRGFIEFHELLGGWRGRTPQLVLHRTGQSAADLAPFERTALDAIFDGQSEIILQDRAAKIMRVAGKEGRRYQAALVERGYLTPERLASRKRGAWLGIALASVGALAFVPAAIMAGTFQLVAAGCRRRYVDHGICLDACCGISARPDTNGSRCVGALAGVSALSEAHQRRGCAGRAVPPPAAVRDCACRCERACAGLQSDQRTASSVVLPNHRWTCPCQ